jgi:thioredoxin-dependent peroxiredoxin
VRDNITSLRRHQIEPLGINPGDAESHREFREEIKLPFELLVDDGLKIAQQYGAVNDKGTGVARSVVVVGKDGKVLFSEPGAPAMARIVNAVKSASDEE